MKLDDRSSGMKQLHGFVNREIMWGKVIDSMDNGGAHQVL